MFLDIGGRSKGVGERLKLFLFLIVDPDVSGSSCPLGVLTEPNYPGMEGILSHQRMFVHIIYIGNLP